MISSGCKIVGYLTEWGEWCAEKVDASKMTHINYAFAQITDGAVSGGNVDKLNALKRIKQDFPHLETLISVGGWGAEGFSDAALTDESRSKFADSAVEYMKANGFDGVDLDWEFPCSSEAEIKSRPEDKQNFTLLLAKVREKLDAAGKADGRHYLLTIATNSMDEYIINLELDAIALLVDFINIMSYDFHHGLSPIAGHHTNLYASSSDDGDRMCAEKSVQGHMNAGVPAHQLVLGCAFYGRGWVAPDGSTNGLYKPIEGVGSEYTYKKLVSEFIDKGGYKRYWDEAAKAPYLWNGSRIISYDDPESLEYKTAFIKAKGLGGAMFWEYSQDDDGVLLNKIYEGLK